MGFGIFKKLKDSFKKSGQWLKNKVIKPAVDIAKKVITPENIKKAISTANNLAPLIGAGVASAMGAPPTAGMQIGHTIQGIGNKFGL